jgi:pimeloyl-ACP methyl ester carboxylesterase
VTDVPLVLLPGLACDASIWAGQTSALSREFEILAWPDFYGHSSLGSMAQAVLDKAPRRFALAGHSMGARVAFEIVARAADRVEKLAVLNTGVAPALPDEPARRQPLIDVAQKHGMAAFAAAWIPQIVHPRRLADTAFVARLTQMICRATPEIYVAQVQALLTRPDFRPLLPRIFRPTLVVAAREDAWSGVAPHEEMTKAILGAELKIIEGCGHMSTVEQPQAVTEALRAWMVR